MKFLNTKKSLKNNNFIALLNRADLIEGPLEISFVSWPMIRYRREVIFGWVDLLGKLLVKYRLFKYIDSNKILTTINILQLLLVA